MKKFLLGVLGISLLVSTIAVVRASDACTATFTAPESCFRVVNMGSVTSNVERKKRAEDGPPPPTHCPQGYSELTGLSDISVLASVCVALEIQVCSVQNIQTAIVSSSVCTAAGSCLPSSAPSSGTQVVCSPAHFSDGMYGVCTQRAVQNFMDAYKNSPVCQELSTNVKCVFNGESGKSYNCDISGSSQKSCFGPKECDVDITGKAEDVFSIISDCQLEKTETFVLKSGVAEKTYNFDCLATGEKKDEEFPDGGSIKPNDRCDTGGRFNADCLFPTWGSDNPNNISQEGDAVPGVIGKNSDGGIMQDADGNILVDKNENVVYGDQLAMFFMPKLIQIILKFVAPIVVIMLIYVGFRFIYSGSNDEERTKSKDFFQYAALGVLFIVLSYTVMKALFNIFFTG